MATITIPTPLRQYAGGQASITLEAATVGELLSSLVEHYPTLGQHLFSAEGKLRSFVNIYVGDEDIRYLQGEETPLRSNEVISIIPAIAGGTTR